MSLRWLDIDQVFFGIFIEQVKVLKQGEKKRNEAKAILTEQDGSMKDLLSVWVLGSLVGHRA